MEISIFGYQLKKQGAEPKKISTPIPPTLDDGATVSNSGAAYYSTVLDLDGVIKGENDLIRRYRECAQYSDVDSAIEDIVNEAISSEDDEKVVELNLEELKIGDGIKKKIEEEFGNIATLLKFNERSHEIFRQWYIDGRIYYNIMVDKDKPKDGIKELRYVDPRKIRKIKIMKKEKSPTGVDLVTVADEYYLFNDKGVTESSTTGVKMSLDSVVYVPSGNFDANTGMALSFLNKAVKPTNQLKMLEDAMVIYRITRAPERRIFYIDVGNLPKQKAEQYVTDMMNKFKNKIVYDACLDMETSVPLLDGRTLSLRDIQTEFEAGKQLWAYSCDPTTGKFVPGLISWAGVTKKDQKVIKITLDNGKSVICTYDHKFPVWGKGKVEAKDLIVGESMIPFYTRDKELGKSEYQQIFKNDTKEWEFTHREVSRWKDSVKMLNEWVANEHYATYDKSVIHHRDFWRRNNAPENLIKMNAVDHIEFHKANNSLSGKIGGKRTVELKVGLHADGVQKELRKRFHEKMKDPIYNAAFCLSQKNNWNDTNKAVMSEFAKSSNLSGRGNAAQKILWANDEYKINRAVKYKVKYFTEQFEALDYCASQQMSKGEAIVYINENCNLSTWIELNEDLVITQKNWQTGIGGSDIDRMITQLGLNGWTQYKTALEFRNHKITRIEYLDEVIDVGCLTIDGDEVYHDHHTFALSAGIYTGNSSGEVRDDRKHMSLIEDFWMPRREGGKGTEITTLPGLQNTNNTEDVQYFQNKVFQALNVPVSRNTPGGPFNVGRGSEITRDEIKFAKFVSRLRTKFSNLFLELLRVQLQMKEIITAKDWPELSSKIKVKYAKDNHFAEFKNNEIMTQRINLLTTMAAFVDQGYYSKPWIRKNVLMQTNDEIKEMDKEREKEAASNPSPDQTAAPQPQEQQE